MITPKDVTQKDAAVIAKIAVKDDQFCPETKEQLQVLIKYPDIPLDAINTADITDMSRLFEKSKRKDFAGINTWDTSAVVDMSYMFAGCERFNEELGADIPATSLVGKLLKRSAKSRFDTSKVKTMAHMFEGCVDFNKPLKLNTAACEDFSCFLKKCKDFNSSVEIDTRSAVNMNRMFEACISFNQALNLDTKNVKNMSYMFRHCRAFNQALNFDTSTCENFNAFLVSCTQFNQPLKFDTSKAKKLNLMFEKCVNLDSQLEFDLSSAEDISRMFSECTRLTKTPILKNLDNVTKAEDVFKKCDKLSDVPDMSAYDFEDCNALHDKPDLNEKPTDTSVRDKKDKAAKDDASKKVINLDDINQLLFQDRGTILSSHCILMNIKKDDAKEFLEDLENRENNLFEFYLDVCDHGGDLEFLTSRYDGDYMEIWADGEDCTSVTPPHIQLNHYTNECIQGFSTDKDCWGFCVVVAHSESFYNIDLDDLRSKWGNNINLDGFYLINQDYGAELAYELGIGVTASDDSTTLNKVLYIPDAKELILEKVRQAGENEQATIDYWETENGAPEDDFTEYLTDDLKEKYVINSYEVSNDGADVQVFVFDKNKQLLYVCGKLVASYKNDPKFSSIKELK